MSTHLGVEMTVLRLRDRTLLMKGMILRRLTSDRPLTKSQLGVGIEQDIIEIQKRFPTFAFESYVGCELDVFYNSMIVAQLINQSGCSGEGKSPLFRRGPLADEFDGTLSDDMEWMVESLPMSTRGFFDQLKSKPDRSVTVSVDEALGKDKRIIIDHSDQAKKQLREGPIIRP